MRFLFLKTRYLHYQCQCFMSHKFKYKLTKPLRVECNPPITRPYIFHSFFFSFRDSRWKAMCWVKSPCLRRQDICKFETLMCIRKREYTTSIICTIEWVRLNHFQDIKPVLIPLACIFKNSTNNRTFFIS